jgi:hypothetical protein
LPRPEHWPKKPVKLMLGLALFGAGGVFGCVWTVIFVNRADYVTAAIAGGFSVFALTFTLAAARPICGWVSTRVTSDPMGTTIRGDFIALALVTISFVAAVPSGTLYIIFVPRGEVTFVTSRGEQIFTPYLIAIAVLCSAAGLIALIVRGGYGYVQLTPHGFEYADILFTRQGAWADVTAITDDANDKYKPFPVVIVMKEGSPLVINSAPGYTPNGVGLYWMIRHYWRHPEHRGELTDGRAIERLRNEQFDVE